MKFLPLHRVASRLWLRVSGRLQWRLLWLANSKYIVGVSGVIQNDAGDVLLMRHRYWQDGTWGLPGGMVKRGETLEGALIRELYEETRLTIGGVRLLTIRSGFEFRLETYLAAKITGGQFQIDPVEILAAEFFPLDAIPSTLLPPHRMILEQFRLE